MHMGCKVASDERGVKRDSGFVKTRMKLFRPSVAASRRERGRGDHCDRSCGHGGHVAQIAEYRLATDDLRRLVEPDVAAHDHLIGGNQHAARGTQPDHRHVVAGREEHSIRQAATEMRKPQVEF